MNNNIACDIDSKRNNRGCVNFLLLIALQIIMSLLSNIFNYIGQDHTVIYEHSNYNIAFIGIDIFLTFVVWFLAFKVTNKTINFVKIISYIMVGSLIWFALFNVIQPDAELLRNMNGYLYSVFSKNFMPSMVFIFVIMICPATRIMLRRSYCSG